MAVLDQILAGTCRRVAALREHTAHLERAAGALPPPPSLRAALSQGDRLALIAEVKRRSPSLGAINPGLDPVELAGRYAAGGAAAISVLTEPAHFGGDIADLEAVSASLRLPTLRKDFIIDPLQLVEARATGAAAALLIVRILPGNTLPNLVTMARDIGLEVLVEVHHASELQRALEADADVIGVNARDLDTLAIDTDSAWDLIGRIPAERVAVAESGMHTAEDVGRAAAAGADAVLVGGVLASSDDPGALAAQLAGVPRRGR